MLQNGGVNTFGTTFSGLGIHIVYHKTKGKNSGFIEKVPRCLKFPVDVRL